MDEFFRPTTIMEEIDLCSRQLELQEKWLKEKVKPYHKPLIVEYFRRD